MMYQITTQDGVVGYTERVEWCNKLRSGSAQVIHERENAAGLVYGDKIYNLPGHDDFEGAETAWATEVNAANVLNEQARQIEAEREAREAVEDALCEADMLAEQRQAEIETALCELDEGV